MRAAYYQGNSTFRVGDAPESEPGPGEVKLKIAYCGICGTDLHIYKGDMDARVGKDKVIGHECSAEVVAVGANSSFQVGDHAVVRPLQSCGACPACLAGNSHVCQKLKFMGVDTEGAFQQYWNVPEKLVHRLPLELPLERAALTEPLAVACHDVRIGEVRSGELVVVIGAGPIGMLIGLAAKERGARVIVCEVNTFRLDLAQKLGMEAVNPQSQDVEEYVNQQSDGAGADVVFEVSGSDGGAELMTKLSKVRGRIVVVAIYAFRPEVDLFRCFWRELKICGARVYQQEDFQEAIRLLTTDIPFGKLITSIGPLSDITGQFEKLTGQGQSMKILVDCQG